MSKFLAYGNLLVEEHGVVVVIFQSPDDCEAVAQNLNQHIFDTDAQADNLSHTHQLA